MAKKRIIQLEGTTSITFNDYLGIDSSADGTRKISFEDFQTAVLGGMDLSKISDDIAPQYDSSVTYSAGDIVIYEDVLYICNGTTTGTWNSAKWDATSVAELIDSLDFSADAISYDNATSGLEAENVQDAIDETITKLSAVGSASGEIATFSDGSDLAMKSLKVAIEPQQEGSGEPSPTNIRPIIGWDEVNVSVCGKNVWNNIPFLENKYISDNNGTISNSNNYNIYKIKNNKNISYKTLSFDFDSTTTNQALRVSLYDENGIVSTFGQIIEINERNTCVINTDSSIDYFLVSVRKEASNIQLENGNQPTAYEPYNGHTYTIDLGGTRYGGTLDVVSGVLTLTHGYIASYNGETLPSTWISDRDVYAEGTTPTIGAEVCYELATPQTIQLTPTQVKSLLGLNNVSADTGEIVEAKYVRDLTTTINYILEQLEG